MEKLQSHNGNIVKEQWKHGEILKLEGSTPKGAGPLFSLLLNKQTREAAVVISIFKVVGVLSCVCLLGLGFCTAMQAAEKPSAPERMKPGLSAHRESDHLTPDEGTGQGIETIKGEVLRIKGQHFYVRQSDGKEMHLHTKPTTQMKREPKKGDHIEVRVDDQNNALSIHQAK